jgi:hypothetical protein
MKGLVFTEFLEMVEQQFGLPIVDKMIGQSNTDTNGAYTAVGTYPHGELVSLVINLHHQTGIPVPDLLKTYGRYLFGRLAILYPNLLTGVASAFDLIENLESIIHVEVKKLYPDANPPMFITESRTAEQLIVTYQSHRSMGDVAEGLINGCGDYYQETFDIKQEILSKDNNNIKFIITKK